MVVDSLQESAIVTVDFESESARLIADMLNSDAMVMQTCVAELGLLPDAPNGIYMSPEHSSSSELPRVLNIDFLPDAFELGAADSHHGVTFGFVDIQREDQTVDTIRVAVKPLDSRSDKACHEQNAHFEVAARGFETFEPLAIVKHDDTSFLITRYRDDLLTRNNIAWTTSPSSVERYEAEVVPTLKFMAESLADLHSAGVFHGDAQAKNFAVSDEGGQVVIDLEDASFVELGEEFAEAFNWLDDLEDDQLYLNRTKENKVFLDLTHCWYALIHPTPDNQTNLFLEGESTEVCMHEFKERFMKPYFSKLKANLPDDIYMKLRIDDLQMSVYKYIERTT